MENIRYSASKLIELAELAFEASSLFEKAAVYSAAQRIKDDFAIQYDKKEVCLSLYESVLSIATFISEVVGYEALSSDLETVRVFINNDVVKLNADIQKFYW